MSTNDPMTRERLDAIQMRLGCDTFTTEDVCILLDEVERLRNFESIVSWRYGDASNGKTQVAMTHRAARALAERFMEHPHLRVGALGHNFYPDARAALDAAFGGREEA